MAGRSFRFARPVFIDRVGPGFGTSPKANLCRTSGSTATRHGEVHTGELQRAARARGPLPLGSPRERSPGRRPAGEGWLQQRLASAVRDISRLEAPQS